MAVTVGGGPGVVPWSGETVITSSTYSVLVSDAGRLLTDTGAGATVTFALPALATANAGLVWYIQNQSGQVTIVSAPANKLIADGAATGSTATFSTASHKIGSFCAVSLNAAGTFYYFQNLGDTAATIA